MSVAAPPFGSAGTSTGVASAATCNVPVPAGVADGDAILVYIYKESSTTITTLPGGFDLVGTIAATGTGAHTLHVFGKIASGADAGTYAFAWTGAVNREGVALRFTGISTSVDPLAGVAAAGSSTSITTSPPVAATSTATGRTVVVATTQFTSGASTPPTGLTEVVDNSTKIAVSYKTYTGALANTGDLSATSTSSAHTAFLVGFRPEPVAPTLSAGADVAVRAGSAFTRTGEVVDDGAEEVVFFEWAITSAPDGIAPGTIGLEQSVAWEPAAPGTYVLAFAGSHLESGLFSYDEVTVTVTAATAFLDRSLSGGQLWVEVAWGADLSAEPDTWEWSDITEDVRTSDGHGIEITIGRADEAADAQPAQCSMVLDNSRGDYTMGGRSASWPNVRRNTPIRVRVFCDGLAAAVSRFEGYAIGWQPQWDITGRNATVELTAAGELRRMAQNTGPGASPYRRAILAGADTSGIVAYWPCEESGIVTGGFSPAVGPYPLRWNLAYLPPVPAENGSFIASDPLPTVENAELYGAVPIYPTATTAQVRALMVFPDSGLNVDQPLLAVDVSGSTNMWLIRYAADGGLNVRVLSSSGSELENTTYPFEVDGLSLLVDLALERNGGSVDYQLSTLQQGTLSGRAVTSSVAGSLGAVQAIWINTHTDWFDDGVDPPEIVIPGDAPLAVGHITVSPTITSIFDNVIEFSGYLGELPYNRAVRVAEESGIRISGHDVQNPALQNTDILGPQLSGATLDILREVEQADKGMLVDGHEFGLSYFTRRALQSSPATLTLTAAQLLPDFTPVDDDQGQVNQITVKVRDGGTVVAEDSVGPLGTAEIGEYAGQVTLNLGLEEAAIQHAAWHVRHGTVEGYRYPSLSFSLAQTPDLVPGWTSLSVGGRVDVTDLLTARPQFPVNAVSLRVLGYTELLSQTQWEASLNTAPYAPWRLVEVGEDASDDGEFVPHLDTLGAELAAPMTVGATSISVATTSGPIWTTAAAAYPMLLDVGGVPVLVDGCTGGASPQTFNLADDSYAETYLAVYAPGATGAPIAKPAGTSVQVWQPPVLGL